MAGGGAQIGGSANCTTTYSDIGSDAKAGTGNISADPLFVSSAQGNFHIMAGSPAWDAADPSASLATDIDGGGATLYVVSQDDDRRSLAMAGYAGGASLAGVGVSWWLTKSRHLRPFPAAMVGASTTSLLLAAMFLPIDEDLHALGPQRPTIRDTAVSGTIFAGAGVGFAVASYLAWRSGRRVPSSSVSPSRRRDAPAGAAVASLIRTRDGAVFGMAGRF